MNWISAAQERFKYLWRSHPRGTEKAGCYSIYLSFPIASLTRGMSYKEPKMPTGIVFYSINSRRMCLGSNSHGLWSLRQAHSCCLCLWVILARGRHEMGRELSCLVHVGPAHLRSRSVTSLCQSSLSSNIKISEHSTRERRPVINGYFPLHIQSQIFL